MVVTCNSFGVSGMDGYKVELEACIKELRIQIPCRTYDREPCPCRYQKRRAYLRFADCDCNSYTAQSD